MLRTSPRNRALSIILIPIIAAVIGISSSWVAAQTPVIPDSEMNLPVCFIQTENSEILDLSKLCNQSGKSRAATSAALASLQKTNQCPGCTLQGTKLAGVSLRGVDLRNAQLSNANLANTSLAFGNLNGASLQNADLSGTNLLGANLAGANLAGANLRGANLRGASLQGANLKGAIMPDGKTHE